MLWRHPSLNKFYNLINIIVYYALDSFFQFLLHIINNNTQGYTLNQYDPFQQFLYKIYKNFCYNLKST